ncbi:hypothetical protein M0R45_026495 [Rubus argutus]|uniref:Uncharacterized protein n=1 Tax=Rubus argutus TaxID=59490 RepID=A0AAW1WXP2_RUBAR
MSTIAMLAATTTSFNMKPSRGLRHPHLLTPSLAPQADLASPISVVDVPSIPAPPRPQRRVAGPCSLAPTKDEKKKKR